jgi:hypothetical protein
MRVYKLHFDSAHYCGVKPLNWKDIDPYQFTEMGKPIAATHTPIPVKIVKRDNRKEQVKARSQLKGDIYGLGIGDPIYGEHAVEVLGDTMSKYGELLLLSGDDGAKYYAYRCTNRKDDASDLVENERRRIANGGLPDIYNFAVKPEVIGDDEIFCVHPDGTYYTDKFKSRVEEAGLKGGKFVEVWSDEKLQVKGLAT